MFARGSGRSRGKRAQVIYTRTVYTTPQRSIYRQVTCYIVMYTQRISDPELVSYTQRMHTFECTQRIFPSVRPIFPRSSVQGLKTIVKQCISFRLRGDQICFEANLRRFLTSLAEIIRGKGLEERRFELLWTLEFKIKTSVIRQVGSKSMVQSGSVNESFQNMFQILSALIRAY